MSLIRAALHNEPLSRELGPLENLAFEFLQGPSHSPTAWAGAGVSVIALLFVGIVQLSVPSSIRVDSSPQGAQVVMNGEVLGDTPLRLTKMERGRHTIELRKEGHRSQVIVADLAAFSPSSYKAKLEEIPPPQPQVLGGETNNSRPMALADVLGTRGTRKTTPVISQSKGKEKKK